jgi:serine/threonine-protein kinase RsbW
MATVQIKDDGIFFGLLQYPEAALPHRLEDAVEGGLGIHLIKSYSEECNYQRVGSENVLTLVLIDSQ